MGSEDWTRKKWEEWFKKTMYSFDKERDIILNSQKCQRNWDTTKKILPEVRDHLLWIAQNVPSKQHEAYYDVYWTDNREVLEELSNYTWGNTHSRMPPSNWKNTQQNASLYILFVAKEPETTYNCNADGSIKDNQHPERWLNSYVSIGIAMGMILQSAHRLGLSTGCNKNHNDINGNDFWENKLNILDDVSRGIKKITYGIGIGFPQKDKPRYWSDQTELMIGAANGSKITLTNQETHPRTNKKMRKAKIVDITKYVGKMVEDPYGNLHKIPEVSLTKINTPRLRNIKLIEIK